MSGISVSDGSVVQGFHDSSHTMLCSEKGQILAEKDTSLCKVASCPRDWWPSGWAICAPMGLPFLPVSSAVLRVPAICRQVFSVWPSDHGHGESVGSAEQKDGMGEGDQSQKRKNQ